MAEVSKEAELAALASLDRQAQEKIEALRQRIEAQQLMLEQIRERMAELEGRKHEVSRTVVTPQHPNGKPRMLFFLSGEQIATQITNLLKENKEPMRLAEIASELERRGVRVKGEQSLMNAAFGVMRRNKERFEKVSRGMYALRQ